MEGRLTHNLKYHIHSSKAVGNGALKNASRHRLYAVSTTPKNRQTLLKPRCLIHEAQTTTICKMQEIEKKRLC